MIKFPSKFKPNPKNPTKNLPKIKIEVVKISKQFFAKFVPTK